MFLDTLSIPQRFLTYCLRLFVHIEIPLLHLSIHHFVWLIAASFRPQASEFLCRKIKLLLYPSMNIACNFIAIIFVSKLLSQTLRKLCTVEFMGWKEFASNSHKSTPVIILERRFTSLSILNTRERPVPKIFGQVSSRFMAWACTTTLLRMCKHLLQFSINFV